MGDRLTKVQGVALSCPNIDTIIKLLSEIVGDRPGRKTVLVLEKILSQLENVRAINKRLRVLAEQYAQELDNGQDQAQR